LRALQASSHVPPRNDGSPLCVKNWMPENSRSNARRLPRHLLLATLVMAPLPTSAAPNSQSSKRDQRAISVGTTHLIGPIQVASAFGITTSIRRSVEHNRRVGGASNSYHLLGQALDVSRFPGVSHKAIDAALRRAGYLLIESIDEIDHSHFAFLPLASPPAPSTFSQATPQQKRTDPLESPIIADNHGALTTAAGGLHVDGGDFGRPLTSQPSPTGGPVSMASRQR
jgi:hypothetical protein